MEDSSLRGHLPRDPGRIDLRISRWMGGKVPGGDDIFSTSHDLSRDEDRKIDFSRAV